MKAEIRKFIEGRLAADKSYAQIREGLRTLDYAATPKKAEELLTEAGVEKTTSKRGIIDNMYLFLAEAPRTAEELKKWVGEHGTDNTKRWIKQHDKARVLANTLHSRANKTIV